MNYYVALIGLWLMISVCYFGIAAISRLSGYMEHQQKITDELRIILKDAE